MGANIQPNQLVWGCPLGRHPPGLKKQVAGGEEKGREKRGQREVSASLGAHGCQRVNDRQFVGHEAMAPEGRDKDRGLGVTSRADDRTCDVRDGHDVPAWRYAVS